MTIGRNEACPCGSGKKFKKCCGSVTKQNEQVSTSQGKTNSRAPRPLTVEMEADALGIPGMQQHLVMRRHYRNPSDPRNTGEMGGSEGEYKVVFTLSRPGYPLQPERSFSAAENLKGDSHLAIAKPALKFPSEEEFDQIELECNTPVGNFVFIGYSNDNGYLGKIESESFHASNYGDAASKAYQALAPALSRMSLYMDIPIHVYQFDITELRTGSVRISITAPFPDVPASMTPTYGPSDELRKYASLYREALNSNSPNYQFLCLYKIIEGLRERRRRLRTQAAIEAKAVAAPPPSYPDERIPKDRAEQIEWLNSIFPLPQKMDDMALNSIFINDAVGRKISNLIDKSKELHNMRLRIAHAVLESGEPTFSIDEGLYLDEVNKWFPITECIARFLLKEAFGEVFKND